MDEGSQHHRARTVQRIQASNNAIFCRQANASLAAVDPDEFDSKWDGRLAKVPMSTQTGN
jgi:hypothetical protein